MLSPTLDFEQEIKFFVGLSPQILIARCSLSAIIDNLTSTLNAMLFLSNNHPLGFFKLSFKSMGLLPKVTILSTFLCILQISLRIAMLK